MSLPPLDPYAWRSYANFLREFELLPHQLVWLCDREAVSWVNVDRQPRDYPGAASSIRFRDGVNPRAMIGAARLAADDPEMVIFGEVTRAHVRDRF